MFVTYNCIFTLHFEDESNKVLCAINIKYSLYLKIF